MYGTVVLEEYVELASGAMTRAVTGEIRVLSSKDALGFEAVTERNANWLVEVSGAGERVFVPGCKVHVVHEHGRGSSGRSVSWVVGGEQ